MKKKLIFLLSTSLCLLTACIQVPDTVRYNGQDIPTIGVAAAGCNKPYVLSQDCSGFSGATRKINFEGYELKIAGSEDGDILMVMANKMFSFDTMKLKIAMGSIEQYLNEKGFSILEMQAIAAGEEIGGFYIVFDGDVYSIMKEFTID